MNSAEVISVPLARIRVGKRLRALDTAWVSLVAASMAESGQHTPIHVGPADAEGMHPLIAGGHRVAAAREAGLESLAAIVFEGDALQSELLEIDENLMRRGLSEMDRAVFLARRKELYEALNPETVNGGNRRDQKDKNVHLFRAPAFSVDVAEKVGLSRRSIDRAIARARIEPDLRAALAPTRWADHGATLDALVRLTPEERRRAVLALTRAEEPAANLAAALAEVKGVREAQRNPADEELARLQTAWRKAGKKARQQFLRIIIENEPEARRFVQDVLRDMEFEGDDRVTRALRHSAQGEAA